MWSHTATAATTDRLKKSTWPSQTLSSRILKHTLLLGLFIHQCIGIGANVCMTHSIYICMYIYIYTHTAKCPTRNPAKKHSINIAIPSFNIIYIIYQALWKHPSLSFKRYLEKPIGVSKCPPHFLQPPRSTRWIFCLLITSQLWR